MENNQFPGNSENNLSENTKNNIFNIGGIKIPEGNTLAIWFLVITVIIIAFLGYGFWSVIDRILDAKLGPDKENTQIVQKDYNTILEQKDSIVELNKQLIDSLRGYKHSVQKTTDSIINKETEPYINKLYKNHKK